jgi:hypothetical protein
MTKSPYRAVLISSLIRRVISPSSMFQATPYRADTGLEQQLIRHPRPTLTDISDVVERVKPKLGVEGVG